MSHPVLHPDEERAAVVRPGQPRPLLDSILEHARRRPLDPALAWQGETVAYGQLQAMARRALTELGRLQLDEQDPVGVLAPKSPQAIALIIACQMAGLRFLLPAVDLPPRILRELFQQAGCRYVLIAGTGPGTAAASLVDHVVPTEPETARKPWKPCVPSPDDVSFMLTTSGSTGVPKIVPLTVGAVDRFTDWAGARFGIRPRARVLSYAPLNFDLSLLDIWTTLKLGGCAVLVDPRRATSAASLADLIAGERVRVVQAVPMLYQLLVSAATSATSAATSAGTTSERCFDTVEHVLFTGDAISLQCLTELPRLFPRARLYNLYGCTETNDSFLHEVGRPVPTRLPIPLGEPLPGVRFLILGEDERAVSGPGCGELLVATPFQTTGYAGSGPDDERFVCHPDGPDHLRYFRSGDLVRRHEDGSLTLEGRKDFQVKVRGVTTNMQDVERVLLEHDEVIEAAVVAVADPLSGRRLHALVRRTAPGSLNSLALRRHCAERLPRTAIPSTVEITEDPLPRTPTGKVDRQLITRMQTGER